MEGTLGNLGKTIGLEAKRKLLISKLTNTETPVKEKLTIVKELFPEDRKREKLALASVDSKGRKVRYFRRLTYAELGGILEGGEMSSLNNPEVKSLFEKQKIYIKSELIRFLEEQNLLDGLKLELDKLFEDFTLENYVNFIQTKIPSLEFYRLQISASGGGYFKGITGISSLSVGAPFGPPLDASIDRSEHKEGVPVIEMIIPAEEVHIHPLFKTMNLEMEKEVEVLKINSDWITDVYLSERDLIERFAEDPNTVLFPFWGKEISHDGWPRRYETRHSIFDTIQEWKRSESIAELVPIEKLTDIDENNPKFKKPLVEIR